MTANIGPIFGTLDRAEKDEVLQNVAILAAERFEQYKQSIVDAFDFRQPRGKEKEEFFAQRMPEVWQALAQANPELYIEQQKMWKEMEQRRLNRAISAYNPFVSNDGAAGSPSGIIPGGGVEGV